MLKSIRMCTSHWDSRGLQCQKYIYFSHVSDMNWLFASAWRPNSFDREDTTGKGHYAFIWCWDVLCVWQTVWQWPIGIVLESDFLYVMAANGSSWHHHITGRVYNWLCNRTWSKCLFLNVGVCKLWRKWAVILIATTILHIIWQEHLLSLVCMQKCGICFLTM